VTRYARELPAVGRLEAPGREVTVAQASGDSPFVLVQADPEAFLLPEVGLRLVRGLSEHPDLALVLPVSNEPWTEEARGVPPFAYSTPTLLAEAAAFLARSAEPLRPCAQPASPVFAVRREVLEALPASLPIERVPMEARALGFASAVDPGAYVHRYGAMDASAREDLAGKVPAGASAVLDVGCSRGATAAALRARGVARIVGIEPDRAAAAEAARVYDRVLARPLEEVAEEFEGEFQAVLFGDVLEHLEDPSAALVRVRPWLAPGGIVVVSVPNAGHWSIVDDLVRGRFDYVPYSLLSGTHLRLFTRRTLVDLFEASGFQPQEIETIALPVSPRGEPRLARLRSFPGATEDLEAAEFLAVARVHPG
jgi:2-polyprenyl-3-methyl-5-hydroxy-6-metoxy-1,4-benzoquinol methylase